MPNKETLLEIIELIKARKVKALSIKQPWPHSIFHEGKDIENRTWSTPYRGWFIIHAGKSFDGPAAAYDDLPRAGIVGLARITDCVSQSSSKWFFGDYGFTLADAFPVELIPCSGRLSFFFPYQTELEQLVAQLSEMAAQ